MAEPSLPPTLVIRTPEGMRSERSYVLSVIFGAWLGLAYRHLPERRSGTLVHGAWNVGGVDRTQPSGPTLALPDTFFGLATRHWREPRSLPLAVADAQTPRPRLAAWDTRELARIEALVDPTVPVIYGDLEPRLGVAADASLRLPVDIFGCAFFMLSRYEETVVEHRDEHERFPSCASTASLAGFLDRPIVDEYVEILWAAMQRLWPGLRRTPRRSRTMVSCDVDVPFLQPPSVWRVGRQVAADLVKRRSPRAALQTALAAYAERRAKDDPDRAAIDWIMESNEAAGNQVAFYFIPLNSDPQFDQCVSLDEPRMRALLREVHARGHEIGVHPGYGTFRHAARFAESVAAMRRVMDEEGIRQGALGGRQHFLRWETPTTARLWEANALDYDSTLTFADHAGFRCGTCREYPLFDLAERRALRVRERPLVVMESTVIAERYMNLGYTDEALDLMQRLRERCHRLGGDFTLLWHNSHFRHPQDQVFYRALIDGPGGRPRSGPERP